MPKYIVKYKYITGKLVTERYEVEAAHYEDVHEVFAATFPELMSSEQEDVEDMLLSEEIIIPENEEII